MQITAEEMKKSKIIRIRSVQDDHYGDMLKYRGLKKQLGLFLDEGLWRCGGRLKNAALNDDKKYPYILPKESYFTQLIIFDAHEEVKHDGVKET